MSRFSAPKSIQKLLYSRALAWILAALLLLAFFLPDLVGPLPALVIGGLIIGLALWVYNLWNKPAPDRDTEC